MNSTPATPSTLSEHLLVEAEEDGVPLKVSLFSLPVEAQTEIVLHLLYNEAYLGLPGITNDAIDVLALPRGKDHLVTIQEHKLALRTSQQALIALSQVSTSLRNLVRTICSCPKRNHLQTISYHLPHIHKAGAYHGIDNIRASAIQHLPVCHTIALHFRKDYGRSAFGYCDLFMLQVPRGFEAPWQASTLDIVMENDRETLRAMPNAAKLHARRQFSEYGLFVPNLTTLRLMFVVDLTSPLFRNFPSLRYLECMVAALLVENDDGAHVFSNTMDLPLLVVLHVHSSKRSCRQPDLLFTFLAHCMLPRLEVFSLKMRTLPSLCIEVHVTTIGMFFFKHCNLKSVSLDVNLHIVQEEANDWYDIYWTDIVEEIVEPYTLALTAVPNLPNLQVIHASPVTLASLPTFNNILAVDLIPRFHVQDPPSILREFRSIVSILKRYAALNKPITVDIVHIANHILDPLGICAVFAFIDGWNNTDNHYLATGICDDLESISQNTPLLKVTERRWSMELEKICMCFRARTMVWLYQKDRFDGDPDETDFSLNPLSAPHITVEHPLHFNFAGVPQDVPRPYLMPAFAWLTLGCFTDIEERDQDAAYMKNDAPLVSSLVTGIRAGRFCLQRVVWDGETQLEYSAYKVDKW